MKKIVLAWSVLLCAVLACQAVLPGQTENEPLVNAASPVPDLDAAEPPSVSLDPDATEPRYYVNAEFIFLIPDGWQTMEELWERPMPAGRDYYGLGVEEVITITNVQEQGQMGVFFTVATSPLAGGVGLEERSILAYQNMITDILNMTRQDFLLNGLAGYEVHCNRPWGEPWWQFRDIWLENNAHVYVLSFHTAPDKLDVHASEMEQILNSFQFSD